VLLQHALRSDSVAVSARCSSETVSALQQRRRDARARALAADEGRAPPAANAEAAAAPGTGGASVPDRSIDQFLIAQR